MSTYDPVYPKPFCDIPEDAFLPGEIALITSPMFQKYDLRLLRNVIINGGQFVDYLFCSDKAQLLGINVLSSNRDSNPKIPLTPIYQVPIRYIESDHMMRGEVDRLLRYLEKILNNPQELLQRPLQICVIPENLYGTMDKLSLVQRLANPRRWQPTWFGLSRKVVMGFLPSNRSHLRPVLFCLDAFMSELKETIDWSKMHDPWACSGTLPWEQRTAAIKQGLPSSNRYASNLVQKFAEAPLEEYLAQYPDSLAYLRENASPCELHSYQDAAGLVYRLYQKPSSQEHGIDLMFHLLKPLFCIDGKKPLFSVKPFLRVPFPTVLHGAALLAKQPVLQWRIEGIMSRFLDDNPKARTTCMKALLRHASGLCPRTTDDVDLNGGYELFFNLTIEPFYLMSLMDKPALPET